MGYDPNWDNHKGQDSPAAQLQAANLFVFTMHNPVMWVDPSGLSAQAYGPVQMLTLLAQMGKMDAANSLAQALIRGTITSCNWNAGSRGGGSDRILTSAQQAMGVEVWMGGGNAFMHFPSINHNIFTNTWTSSSVILSLPVDEFGFSPNEHRVTTSITGLRGSYDVSWRITHRGTIHIIFGETNNFPMIESIGGTEPLAREMLRVTRSFDSSLSGRTVGGIMTDLRGHYYLSQGAAHMGGLNRNHLCYDHNAWYSEALYLGSFPIPVAPLVAPRRIWRELR